MTDFNAYLGSHVILGFYFQMGHKMLQILMVYISVH
jgi:hypothetical protein